MDTLIALARVQHISTHYLPFSPTSSSAGLMPGVYFTSSGDRHYLNSAEWGGCLKNRARGQTSETNSKRLQARDARVIHGPGDGCSHTRSQDQQ